MPRIILESKDLERMKASLMHITVWYWNIVQGCPKLLLVYKDFDAISGGINYLLIKSICASLAGFCPTYSHSLKC